ncbi:hypothetical protein ARMGADRAFT_1171951 [Armillaria gallica]|uniref:Uncharacterized protein n=1 Tax=Armillaria gallica TaxID=47427 RepID=A0A2H3CM95_ARMGA|nr:hypothetical protein ARMGADRAFT_1171951 [Armillaria gallica]
MSDTFYHPEDGWRLRIRRKSDREEVTGDRSRSDIVNLENNCHGFRFCTAGIFVLHKAVKLNPNAATSTLLFTEPVQTQSELLASYQASPSFCIHTAASHASMSGIATHDKPLMERTSLTYAMKPTVILIPFPPSSAAKEVPTLFHPHENPAASIVLGIVDDTTVGNRCNGYSHMGGFEHSFDAAVACADAMYGKELLSVQESCGTKQLCVDAHISVDTPQGDWGVMLVGNEMSHTRKSCYGVRRSALVYLSALMNDF